MTQGYVSSLERDARKPSRDMVRTIVKALYEGSDPQIYARAEAEAMKAAGFLPDSPIDDLNQLPLKLQQAIALLQELPRDVQETMSELWLMQVRPHHSIEMHRQERERQEAEASKNTSYREVIQKPTEQLEYEHGYDAATAPLRTPEGIKVRAKLREDFPKFPDDLIDQMARSYLYAVQDEEREKEKKTRMGELVNKI